MGKDKYNGKVERFCFPNMTWDDYYEIIELMRGVKNRKKLLAFCMGEMYIKPYKERTKDYIISIIKNIQ